MGCPSSCCGVAVVLLAVAGTRGVAVVLLWGGRGPAVTWPRPLGCPSSCCGVAGSHKVPMVLLWGDQDPWGAHHPAVGWPWSFHGVARTCGVAMVLLWRPGPMGWPSSCYGVAVVLLAVAGTHRVAVVLLWGGQGL